MKFTKFLLLAGLLGMAGAALAQTPAPKIGVIDYGRLINESSQGKAAQQALKNEFAPKEQALLAQQNVIKQKGEKYERDKATLSAAEQSKTEKELRDGIRDLQTKQAKTQDEFETRRNDEMSKLQRQLVQEVQGYAKQNGYDIVITSGAVAYMKDALDITSPVLAALQAKSGRPPAAPSKPATPTR